MGDSVCDQHDIVAVLEQMVSPPAGVEVSRFADAICIHDGRAWGMPTNVEQADAEQTYTQASMATYIYTFTSVPKRLRKQNGDTPHT